MIGGLALAFGAIVFQFAIFTVVLPSIRSEFDLAPDTASWLLLVHSIPLVALMPLYGRLGDKYGARRLICVGLGLFASGTILCIVAQTMGLLFAGRIAQAAGASGINPLSLSILTRVFPPEQRGRAIGLWTASGPFVTVVGRLVGGFIVESFGWRSAFAPALIVAILATPVLILAVPNTRATDRDAPHGRIDTAGLVTTSMLVTSLVLFVSSRAVTGRTAFTDVRLMILLVACGITWLFVELRSKDPFVPISLFRNRDFSAASWLAFVRMIMLGSLFF